jgi:hypothetical protein
MDAVIWTYIYLKGIMFGMVCAMILAVPYASSLEPGEGIPGRYFLYIGVGIIGGYLIGLYYLV